MVMVKNQNTERLKIELSTESPCNWWILGEKKIRKLQNQEFQGPPYLGLDVP